MKDLFGKALMDYYQNSFQAPLVLHNEYGSPEIIPIERYFNDQNEYSYLEIYGLQQAIGRIIDIGAATGRHALFLQKNGFDVTAMDISPTCLELMAKMGVRSAICEDIYKYEGELFDTGLMLMNGIGLAGNIAGLQNLLYQLKKVIKSNGQLLLDSSDISYLYEKREKPESKYYGELRFQYEYKGVKDTPFNWLYIDQNKLMEVAAETGWSCQIIYSDETDAYLARLQHF